MAETDALTPTIFNLMLAFNRVALSPLDNSKAATAGAHGLFRIWKTKQGGKVTPMVPIAGFREVRRSVAKG